MPKTLYNIASHGQVIGPDERAVMPGEGREFSDEELGTDEVPGTRSLLGWSETGPRAGLAEEKAWKAKRDTAPEVPAAEPATQEKEG
jgi:hypothetical protein